MNEQHSENSENIIPAREQADAPTAAEPASAKRRRLPVSASDMIAIVLAAAALWFAAGQQERIDELENRLALMDAQLARNVDFTAKLNKRQVDLEQHFADLIASDRGTAPAKTANGAATSAPAADAVPAQKTEPAASASKPSATTVQSPTASTPAKPPTAAPKPAGEQTDGSWKVNLVSLASEQAAQREVQRLQSLGIDADYHALTIKGKRWYRVQVGGFATRKAAEKAAQDLAHRLDMQDVWVGR